MSKTAVFLTIVAVILATGGFGLFVPRIYGLPEAGDYYGLRVILAAFLVLASAPVLIFGGLKLGTRMGEVCVCAPIAFASSVFINLTLGQDPFFAELNYRAPLVDFQAVNAGTEAEGMYGIENHESLCFDEQTERYFVSGPGLRVPIWLQDRYGREQF
jgi:hypothetical protein